jgi:hypothetical protein
MYPNKKAFKIINIAYPLDYCVFYDRNQGGLMLGTVLSKIFIKKLNKLNKYFFLKKVKTFILKLV